MQRTAEVSLPPDGELVRRATLRTTPEVLRVATASFHELFQRHAPSLAAFLFARLERHAAEDLAQEVWLKAWSKLTIDAGKHFRAWLFEIARNAMIDAGRKRRPEHRESWEDAEDGRATDPTRPLLEAEREAALADCLARLEESLANVFRGRLSGEDFESLAERLSLSVDQTYKKLHMAKERLKACIEAKLP